MHISIGAREISMHDIDRALFETEQEEGEYEGEASDSRELALAGELLEITNEEELDRFLGRLVGGAVKAGRAFLSSDAGRAVGGVLKSAAKQALPQIGRAVGGYIAPGGGDVGAALGSYAGKALGLELEGLSHEDREYEVSRAFVRFANEVARTTAAAPPSVPAAVAASRAATIAATRHLPGLVPVVQRLRPPGVLAGPPSASFGPPRRRASSGRWVRRDASSIVVHNV